jgi:hypothetical protein
VFRHLVAGQADMLAQSAQLYREGVGNMRPSLQLTVDLPTFSCGWGVVRSITMLARARYSPRLIADEAKEPGKDAYPNACTFIS